MTAEGCVPLRMCFLELVGVVESQVGKESQASNSYIQVHVGEVNNVRMQAGKQQARRSHIHRQMPR
jgi:hypothetical protein